MNGEVSISTMFISGLIAVCVCFGLLSFTWKVTDAYGVNPYVNHDKQLDRDCKYWGYDGHTYDNGSYCYKVSGQDIIKKSYSDLQLIHGDIK